VANSQRGTVDDFADARLDRRIAASRYQLTPEPMRKSWNWSPRKWKLVQ
jgi:hypothetical protein